ncbi:MAG: hypothetical protein RL223_3507, partial [Pseudomonadota bacterium]
MRSTAVIEGAADVPPGAVRAPDEVAPDAAREAAAQAAQAARHRRRRRRARR